ncbi:MAG: DnaJ C-terminal domain-containing protein [Vicinamibacterales bacterium]
MEFKDYYATLGVAKTATEKEIKQAFRKLARKFHPDVNPGDAAAENRFKDVNEAYEVLGTAETRRKYDELGANWRMYEQQAAQGGPGGPWGAGGPPGGQRGYRTMTQEEVEELFGGGNPFSDFFTTFFGGGGGGGAAPGAGRPGRRRAAQRRGRDVEHEIELTLEDAFHGATRRLALSHDGEVRHVDVRIPAGVGDGSRVRVSSEGEPGSGGAAAGDLYLRVRLAPHAQFERKGRDIYSRLKVPVTTAVLGGQVEVQTLSGRQVRLRIPECTQAGQLFRLKGYGMPASGRDTSPGDAYARVEVQMPSVLTPEARTHYEALAALAGRDHTQPGPQE